MKQESDLQQEQSSIELALRPNQLRVGDIILSTTSAYESWLIRKATKSNFSHAALYVGGGYVIEAVGGGVRRIHVRALRTHQRIGVFRPAQMSLHQLEAVSLVARSLLYRPYSIRGALSTKMRLFRDKNSPALFCSQLVAESFATEGFAFDVDRLPADFTPEDIFRSTNIELEEVTEQVINYLPTVSINRAVEALKPTMKAVVPDQKNEPQISIPSVEDKLLKAAATKMRKYRCFQKPYHYFNALRQIYDQFRDYSVAARAVDEVLSKALKELGVTSSKVAFHPSCPGIVSDLMSFNIFPVVDAGETEEDLTAFNKLVADIRYSEQWDREDWSQTLSEFERAYEETNLESLGITHFWLLADYSVVDANYKMLEMFPGHVIRF
jgi:uncharacterized protein YycO